MTWARDEKGGFVFPRRACLGAMLMAGLLAGCAPTDRTKYDSWTRTWGKDYSGPVAPPQAVYRIDEHRFFEAVPYRNGACSEARLYYTDTVKGIHTNIGPFDTVEQDSITYDGKIIERNSTFIIDAASDQYLIAPVINSSSNCQSGGRGRCTDYFYFSQDAGRTWIGDMGSGNYLTGNTVYSWNGKQPGDVASGDKARLDVPMPDGPHWVVSSSGASKKPDGPHWEIQPSGNVRNFKTDKDGYFPHDVLKWETFLKEKIPLPVKPPVDTRIRCKRNRKG